MFFFLFCLDKPYFSSSPQSVEVFEGSKIILPCKVMSEPSSTISWKKYEDAVELDDERIFQTFEGTLVIMDVSLSDEGVYSCTGENELGSISKEIQVLVKQGTFIIFYFLMPNNLLQPPKVVILRNDSIFILNVTCIVWLVRGKSSKNFSSYKHNLYCGQVSTTHGNCAFFC